MATPPVVPLVLRDCLLTIDVDNFEKHVSGVKWTPDVPMEDWRGVSPGTGFSEPGEPRWSIQLPYVQDWQTPNSLADYLHSHIGQSVVMTFTPIKAGAGGLWKFTATVRIVPGAIGGERDRFADERVTFPSTPPVKGAA